MAETIGDLSVDLRLTSAKFEQGVGRVNKRMDGMQRQAEKASRVFRGLLAIGGGVAFTGMIKGSLDAANRLNDLSDRLGVSVEGMSRLEYAAKKTGVAQTNLTTGLQRMTRRVSEAARGTGEAVGALKELGLSAEDLNKLAPEEQFMRLADALEAVPNQADKVRLGMKLLDSEGVALLQTMKGGSDAIRQLGEESDRTGNTITSKFAAKATLANAAIIKMKGAAQGLTNEMAVNLAPAIESSATWMAENAESVRNGAIAFIAITGAIKAASVAQASFNAVARLNPYIALATAVGIATVAIYEFVTAQSAAEDRVVSLWESAAGSSAAYMAAQSKINESQAVHDKLVKQQAEKQGELNRLRAEGFKKYSSDGNKARALESDIADIVDRRTRLTNARIEADKAEASRRKKRQDEEEAYLNRINELLDQTNAKSSGSPEGKDKAGDRAEKLRSSLDERFAIQMTYQERLREAMEIFAEGEIDLAERTELEKLAAQAKARAESGLNAESRQEQYDSHIQEFKAYQEELTAKQQRESQRRAQIEKQAQDTIRSLHQSTWSEAANLLNVFAGKNKAAAIASIAITKGIAIAQTMAHTQTAAILAFASQLIPGDPTSLARAQAASTAAQGLGAVKVGLIAASGLAQAYQVTDGGGGSVGTGGYSSSGTNPPVPSSPNIPSAGAEDDKRGVQINFYGNVNGLDADQIARSLKDHLDSTDFVLVEPASRNGRALRTA